MFPTAEIVHRSVEIMTEILLFLLGAVWSALLYPAEFLTTIYNNMFYKVVTLLVLGLAFLASIIVYLLDRLREIERQNALPVQPGQPENARNERGDQNNNNNNPPPRQPNQQPPPPPDAPNAPPPPPPNAPAPRRRRQPAEYKRIITVKIVETVTR